MSMFDISVPKNGQVLCIFLSSPSRSSRDAPGAPRNASTAEPKPYQPGSATRHWPQLNDQGIARRSSIARVDLRDAGREPMLSSAISRIGVVSKK